MYLGNSNYISSSFTWDKAMKTALVGFGLFFGVYQCDSCSEKKTKDFCKTYGYVQGKNGFLKINADSSVFVRRQGTEENNDGVLVNFNKNTVSVLETSVSGSKTTKTYKDSNPVMTIDQFTNNVFITSGGNSSTNSNIIKEARTFYEAQLKLNTNKLN